ncbi:MAG TPA: hypothetical protein VM577_09050 [Anaerovoracaceae bacterium]|nr:hypothetical protein [Anaerovoracaceae bacterium]
MNFLTKLFHIPTPMELGKSDSSALPSDFFPNETEDGEEEYTWEKYDAEMQAAYPVRWFITRTIPRIWSRYIWGRMMLTPLERARYWLVSHLIPSRRYHMLDLRQPDGYRYGWVDAPQQLLYANFAILKNYVEGELDGKVPRYKEEEHQDWLEGARSWNKHYEEIENLYKYWTVDRAIWQKKLGDMSHMANVIRNDQRNFVEGNNLYDKLREEQKKFDEFETEALIRLIKTREGMWT